MLAEKANIPTQEPVAGNISEGTDTRTLLIGVATTAFAGLCFTSGNTLVKLLPPGSSFDILLLRSLIQVMVVLVSFQINLDYNIITGAA